MNEPAPAEKTSPAGRATAVALGVSALAILLLGGALPNLRALPSGRVPEDTTLPVPLEPVGDLPAPPTVFRWTPGGDDVDFSQVIVFNARYERLWESAPVRGQEITVDPREIFDGIAAGYLLSWSVREVFRGRPRATSAVVDFTFDTDVDGRGIGESRPGNRALDR